jgi:hypothetical protein
VDDAAERRRFAFALRQGTWDGIDLSVLDPDDEDDSLTLAHAELDILGGRQLARRGPAAIADTTHLDVTLRAVAMRQLWAGDPPELWATARRLRGEGRAREEIMLMLTWRIGVSIAGVVLDDEAFDAAGHLRSLDALPGSWDAASRGAARQRAARSRRRGGARRR